MAASELRPHVERLLQVLREDPYRSRPPFEKLVGDLAGAFSRRINIRHRLVYQVLANELSKCSACGPTTNEPAARDRV